MQFSIKQIMLSVSFVLALVYSGWYAHGVYYGYKQGQAAEIQEIVRSGMKDIEDNNAKQLMGIQQDMKGLKTETIERQIPIIVNNPVYKEVCTTSEGIDLLQEYKNKSNAIRHGKAVK